MLRRADKIPVRNTDRLGEALERLITFAEATNKADDAKALRNERAKRRANPTGLGTEKR
jgi:hypothetical protein